MAVRVQAEPIHTGDELALLTAGRVDIGAVASFVGHVRGQPSGQEQERLIALTLEHYPGMTERMMADIEAEANRRWPLLAVSVIHRVGRLLPGEAIVLVAVASSHRQAAFDACAFIMDWLKTDAPFWKLEETENGSAWVAARDGDQAAKDRWNS